MAKPPADDPFEFDPMAEAPKPARKELELKLEFDPSPQSDDDGEIAPPPPEDEVMAPARTSRDLDASSLFPDDDGPQLDDRETKILSAPVKKREALSIDFNELLPAEQARGAMRVGASKLDTSEFLSRDDKEAMARAKRQPRDQVLELSEDRQGAMRIVAENHSVWIYFAVGTVVALLAIIGGMTLYQRHRASQSVVELEELRAGDKRLREQDQKRETDVAR